MSSAAAARSESAVAVATMDARPATSPKRRRLDAFEAAGDAILTVWSVIGSFLDPLDLSRCAKTCRELRNATINEHDGKIIATHIRIGFSNEPHNQHRALLSICSPRIQALNMCLQGTIVDGREIRDEHTGAFPMLVATLSACRKLETLSIDTGNLFENNRLETLAANMKLFEEFLLSCEHLNSFTILSTNLFSSNKSVEALWQIITKVIAKKKLRILSLHFNDFVVEDSQSSSNLAHAIARADNLECLELSGFDYDFFVGLMSQIKECSKNKGCLKALSGLKNISLQGHYDAVPDGCNLTELFYCFGNCHSLEKIQLVFPVEIWDNLDDCFECLKALLQSKTQLQDVFLAFGYIKDTRVGDYIAGQVTTKEWTSFYVEELRFSTEAVNNILQHLEHAGSKYEFVETDRGTEWIDCSFLDFPKQKN